MKTLVTGATGFVGGHLCKFLLDQGLDIKVLARNPNKLTPEASKNYEIAKGDITEKASLLNALEGVDQVFHLAGVVGYSKAQYESMYSVNVNGTQNLLEAMKEKNISNLLHFSSVVAIGASFTPTPMTEKDAYNIAHLNLGYFNTKKKAEDLVLEAFKEGYLAPKIVNPSTIYGYGDAQKGSRSVQLKVAKGKFPVYPPGGVNVVAIEDVLSGAWAAHTKGKPGERYILSGDNLTIKQLFEAIAKSAGQKPPTLPLPKFALNTLGAIGDGLEKLGLKGPLNSETAWTSQLYHWFDSTKAQNELGFSPRPSQEAIENSVRWIKENSDSPS